jgi:hypothetical protein
LKIVACWGGFHSGLLENSVVWADVSEDEQILLDFEGESEGVARTSLRRQGCFPETVLKLPAVPLTGFPLENLLQ